MSDTARDEVDRIVEAWRRERPDLDVGPLEVLSRVTRLARHLDRDRAAAFARHELEPWEFDVLAALRRSGPPYHLSAGRLAELTMVTSGTMTDRIDRLAERELVARLLDPEDGRGVMARLTGRGRGLVDTALEDLLERERALLGMLDLGRRRELATLLRRLTIPFDS
jgi:DNA-binding MarR family transcriptional regulator